MVTITWSVRPESPSDLIVSGTICEALPAKRAERSSDSFRKRDEERFQEIIKLIA